MTCIPLHKTWHMNLLWPMDPQYQSRDDLHTTTQNLADEPTLANGPPSTRAEMTCIPLHKTWQMNLLWLRWTPQYQSRDDLHTTTQNLADEPTLAQWMPPGISSIDALEYCYNQWQTWQTNLLWLMDPLGTRSR